MAAEAKSPLGRLKDHGTTSISGGLESEDEQQTSRDIGAAAHARSVKNGEDVSSGQGNTATTVQSASIQSLPVVRAFARVLPAVQNVPLVPKKTGVARFIARCG